MNRIILNSALALSLAATAAFAQQSTQQPAQPSGDATAQQPTGQYGHHGRHGKMDPHKAAQHIGKRLGLSADQTAKLEPILADRQQKMATLRQDTSLTSEQRKAQFKALHEDTKTQLATILTPDQMQQLRSMRRGPHGKRQQQPEAATPPSAS